MTEDENGAAAGIDPETVKAIQYSEKLLETAISVVGAARVDLDERGARNPTVIALTLLCRSISNFRAAILLVQQRHVLEAGTLVRCLYENLLWMGALRERGTAFVQDMIRDEGFNRKALGELTLRLSSKHGSDVDDADSLTLRNIVRNWPSSSRGRKSCALIRPRRQGLSSSRMWSTRGCRSMLCTVPSLRSGVIYRVSGLRTGWNSS